jgi:hydrogenase maturation protease
LKTLILGVGSPLRTDDGVGIHVIEALREEDLPNSVELREDLSCRDLFDAFPDFDRIIIIDAIKSNDKPGTIQKYHINDSVSYEQVQISMSHGIDLLMMIELGRRSFPDKMPKEIIIIAVEAEDVMTISDKCTPKVQEAIHRVVSLIKEIV